MTAVTGVVTDSSARVLLVKGDRRGWEPPGGQVELGEDLVTALRWEVREESGCEVEVGGLVSMHPNLGRPEKGVPEQVVLTFSCRWAGGEVRAGEECSDAALFPAEEALRLVEAPQQREKLRDALAGVSGGGAPRKPGGALPRVQDATLRGVAHTLEALETYPIPAPGSSLLRGATRRRGTGT